MKEIGKKVFSIFLCSLLVFILIGCDDSTSQAIEDINNEVRSYEEVDVSDVPDLEDGSQDFDDISEMTDFTVEGYIDDYFPEMMLIMASGLGTISNVTESYMEGDGTLSNSKDMEIGLAIHIDDEQMYYTEDGQEDYNFSMDIDWFDLVFIGSTDTSIVDILNHGFEDLPPDMSLYVSTNFILGYNGDYDYIPYSLKLSIETEQNSSGETEVSGSFNLSFASRNINTSYLGVMGFKFDIADFEGLTEDDIEDVNDILDQVDSDSDLDEVWDDIEEIMWGNTEDTHLTLEISVADSTGLLGSQVYEDEELLSIGN
ncbi:MAG: hypothetical protein OWP43_13280 [Sphaerochaetaceae bacterium]|nr:hypothetical protein [Sphaerochaetaceae bacterium]